MSKLKKLGAMRYPERQGRTTFKPSEGGSFADMIQQAMRSNNPMLVKALQDVQKDAQRQNQTP